MRISDWSSDVCSSDLAQTRAVFANVRAVLGASGARWEDLVDVTVYLTDMASDFKAYNAVWAEHFPDPASAACRTTLGIDALPTPIAIELKSIEAFKEYSMLPIPLHLQDWNEQTRHMLNPPIGTKDHNNGGVIHRLCGRP